MASTSFVLSNSRNSLTTERRFTNDTIVSVLKGKLELMTGIMMHEMKLEVYDATDNLLATLDDDTASLGFYSFPNGCRLHVIDITNKSIDMEEELSKVKKFEISEEDYEKRNDSVRAFKKQMKLGNFDAEKQRAAAEREQAERQLADTMKVGDRCEVTLDKQAPRRGAIAYIGEVEFKPNLIWIGLRYDEPVGKNNGSVQGRAYFSCPDKYGGFVRPSSMKVGEYPPLEDLELDEI